MERWNNNQQKVGGKQEVSVGKRQSTNKEKVREKLEL
jgi:hypothetical protein